MGRLRAWGSPGVCQPQRRGLGRWPVFGYVSVDPPTPPEQHAMRIRITPRQRSHHPENEAGFGFHLDRGRARQGGGAGSTPPQRRQPEPGPGLRHGSPVWCAHARRDGSGERKEPEPHARYAYGANRLSMTATGDPGVGRFHHADGLGSTCTDATGEEQWRYSYEPYGATRAATQVPSAHRRTRRSGPATTPSPGPHQPACPPVRRHHRPVHPNRLGQRRDRRRHRHRAHPRLERGPGRAP